jgi:hypothetical protein
MLIWPMEYRGDERTRQMLERALEPGTPENEALDETHGMVSDARAPHQEHSEAT